MVMDNTKGAAEAEVQRKYYVLLSLVRDMENRLAWSGLVFLGLTLFNAVFCFYFISWLLRQTVFLVTPLEMCIMLFSLVIGMVISAYWAAHDNRLQLKLKLRYFQARYLERRINRSGEHFLGDEALFFDSSVPEVVSPDGEEILRYPRRGPLRMDGFIGSARPRYFSLLLPCMFFLIFGALFLWLLVTL